MCKGFEVGKKCTRGKNGWKVEVLKYDLGVGGEGRLDYLGFRR